MAISDKLTSIQNHLTDDWNSIESLIGDTDLDKNIENIAGALDNLYDDLPKVTGSGTSITLDDTRKGRLESELGGNTSQFTTTGKNLLPNDTETKTRNGITITKNSDGTYKINGTATDDFSEAICNNFIPMSGTWRMLGCPSGGSDSTYMLSAYVGYWGAGSPNIDIGNGTNITYTGNVKVRFYIKSGTTCNNLIFKPMLTTDTSTTINDFEPYTGGQASPNPDYPQDIHVVSGDNEIEVCGKNLIGLGTILHAYRDNSTGKIQLNDNCVGYYFPTSVLPDTITFSCVGGNRANISYYNSVPASTVESVDYSNSNSLPRTISVNKTYAYIFIQFSYNTLDVTNIQLEKGSTASTYEPYNGDTYNIDLPEGMELCKIGNYQDYFYKDNGKWYLHKEIGKKVYDGSEYFGYGASGETGISVVNTGGIGMKQGNYLGGKSNYFMNNQSGKLVNTIRFGANDTNIWIYISSSDFTSADDFKTWVSTHNTIVYFVLETPTNTEITYQPLIDQLNLLEKSMSKDGQTNISQVNNDLPFIISASALKEWSV